jgi:aminopeptidase N
MVVVAESLYSNPSRRGSFEGATAHEVAHQYWYNVVGDDQINNPWLDEAMAQYSTGLYFDAQHGEAAGRAYRAQDYQGRWDRVRDVAKPIGLPVDAYNDAEYSGIVYGRGPLFLMALQDQIGQDKMTEFLRRYYREYAWRIATPAEFQRLAEEVSGQDLTTLFDTWVYPPK